MSDNNLKEISIDGYELVKVDNNNYSKAYTEVLEILKNVSKNDYNKIPKNNFLYRRKIKWRLNALEKILKEANKKR